MLRAGRGGRSMCVTQMADLFPLLRALTSGLAAYGQEDRPALTATADGAATVAF